MLSASFATTVRFPTRSSEERREKEGDHKPSCALPPAHHEKEVPLHVPSLYNTLTVEPKVFGEGLCTEELKALGNEETHSPGIPIQATRGKTLIGGVKEGEQEPALQGRNCFESHLAFIVYHPYKYLLRCW